MPKSVLVDAPPRLKEARSKPAVVTNPADAAPDPQRTADLWAADTLEDAAPPPQPGGCEGFIEIYGRQEAAQCWVLGGWISRAWMTEAARTVTAVFERGSATGAAQVVFYEREDLGARGIGFMLVLQTQQRRLGRLLRLDLVFQQAAASIGPAGTIRELTEPAIMERAEALLGSCIAQPDVPVLQTLLARRFVGEGYIDLYGYHAPSAGWFVCGWISNDWIAHAQDRLDVVAHFEGGSSTGAGVLNYYERDDLRGKGLGVVLHLSTVENRLGRLLTLTLCAGGAVVVARPARVIEMIPDDTIAKNLAGVIAGSDPGAARDELRRLASRMAYDGQDTIAELRDPVYIDFDEAIVCAPDSVILLGWMLAKPGTIKAMRLRSAQHVFPVDMNTGFVWIDRKDVIDAVGREHGFDDPRCGFIARVPTGQPVSDDAYLEIETVSGSVGTKKLPRSRLAGIAAMKRMLGVLDTQYANVDAIYDHVLGPAIGALNADRLQTPPNIQTLQLGPAVPSPRHSVIVPLYGRIDFMEFQLALFATAGLGADVELIYVLDDPPRTREAQFLAASLYERFRVPFRLLCLSHNVGFAPANNIGVRAASGKYICFMNSDVFPTTGDWLDRLAAHLDAAPDLGVVGPVLLFDDGSVQHQGISFKNLPQFGNWSFAQHKRKGFRVPQASGLVREIAITGACMLVRRESVLAYGGFDEAFIVGDFEDTDLCFRLRNKGLGAAVDFGVSMYHLERKSQASSAHAWRTNLTVYNAWVHQRRWAGTIRGLAS